jgi:hypothetical protein
MHPPNGVATKRGPLHETINFLFRNLTGWTPTVNQDKRLAYKKAFQTLWVAGTLGAFFTALVRTLPLYLKQAHWNFDPAYTADTFVRYGYLLWLLAYFFVSNLEIAQAKSLQKWDITYDILQSICSLTAAFFLGFILPDQRYGFPIAYVLTNGAIFVICLFSLIWFRKGALQGLNRLRGTGAVISAVSLLLALGTGETTGTFLIFAGLQAVLWITLAAYVRIRMDTIPTPEEVALPVKKLEVPVNKVESPTEKVEAPVKKVEAPVDDGQTGG